MKAAWPVVFVLILGIASGAAADPRKDFAKAQKHAARAEAYARAERRLAKVHAGMSQVQFFEVMEMMVLAHEKKQVGSLVEGFLRAQGPDGLPIDLDNPQEERHLLFGYVEGGHEVVKLRVVFRDNRLSRLIEDEPGTMARIWGQADPNS